jgi:hypothetical protein
MARVLYEPLLGLVEDGDVDVLVAKAAKLNCLLDQAPLPLAVGYVPVNLVLDLLPSVYLALAHTLY